MLKQITMEEAVKRQEKAIKRIKTLEREIRRYTQMMKQGMEYGAHPDYIEELEALIIEREEELDRLHIWLR